MNATGKNSVAARQSKRDILLSEVFAAERIQVDVNVSSHKRMIEMLSNLFTKNNHHIVNKNTVFHALLERERIGSTCVGNGVAIPHGRLSDLEEAMGAILRMKTPLNLDAIDDKPVILACGLLVPADCAEVHIRILSRLARGFSQGDLCRRMLEAKDSNQLFSQIVEFENESVLA